MKTFKKQKTIVLLVFLCLVSDISSKAQNIADFTSINPTTQNQEFRIADSHEFQFIAREDTPNLPINNGFDYPDKFDFTAYVPHRSNYDTVNYQGYISLNHERTDGDVTIIDISFDPALKKWLPSASQAIDFSAVGGVQKPCAGAVTDWGTVLVAEEVAIVGNMIEIDPQTKTVEGVWHAMGNYAHENQAIHANNQTFYGGQDENRGYLYKFVANSAGSSTTAADLSSGDLYALKLTGDSTTGEWVLLPNAQNTNTSAQANIAGATCFRGIETVQISPINGDIYFAVKGNNSTSSTCLPNTPDVGVVYRFTDTAPLDGGAAITNFEVFAGNDMDYTISDTLIPYGEGVDNIAFDGEGNLWTLQDGGNNYIWVFGPNHTQANPDVRIFGQAPLGYEPTGITFTPDYKYLFMSLQGNGSANATSECDVFNVCFPFDGEDAALVIALDENLDETCNSIADAGADKSICSGGNGEQLDGLGNGSFAWSPTQGLSCTDCATPIANPAQTTTYTLTTTLSPGCTATDQVTVTVTNTPDAVILVNGVSQSSLNICPGEQVTLQASGGGIYQWSTGETSNSIIVSPLAETSYTLTANINNCTDTEQILITVEEDNIPPLAQNDDFTFPSNAPFSGNVLTNDSDSNNDNLSVTALINFPDNGSVSMNPDGTFTYTPDNDFTGIDIFEYQVCDDGACDATPVSGNFEGQVSSSTDDAEEAPSTGVVSVISSDLELIYDSWTNVNESQIVGIRIAGINIPQGAVITSAYLQFTADNENNNFNTTGIPTINISAQDTGNAATFTTATSSLSNLLATATTATTSWTINEFWTDSNAYNSADISPVVQEVINRGDWQSGNAMSFLITDNNNGTIGRRVEAHDGNAAIAPKLFVAYETGGATGLCSTATVTLQVEPDCVDIQLSAFLEGCYDSTTGEMTTDLNYFGMLPGQTPLNSISPPTPAGQPYNIAPWNYMGTEGAGWTDSDYIGDEVDWVLVSFRTGIGKNTEIARAAALLIKDGSFRFPNPCALPATLFSTPLYVVVEHRNHMAIMTAQAISTGNTLAHNFLLQNSYTANDTGVGQKVLPTGEWVMLSGDSSQATDTLGYDINGLDKAAWYANNGIAFVYSSSDFNLGADVNGGDKLLWFPNNGLSSAVPR